MNDIFEVDIPILPPGKNATYGVGRGKGKKGRPRLYITREAKKWVADATLIINAKKNAEGWKHIFDYYTLDITFSSKSRLDVDAPIALVQDTLMRALASDDDDLDDRLIIRTTCEKADGIEGVHLVLKGFKE